VIVHCTEDGQVKNVDIPTDKLSDESDIINRFYSLGIDK